MQPEQHLTKAEALEFFSEFYGGHHHIPGYGDNNIKNSGFGFYINHPYGSLATFDGSKLTKLVLMAHEKCIRVELEAVRNGIIKIIIWKRQGRDGQIFHRHPTIETAIEGYRQTLKTKK